MTHALIYCYFLPSQAVQLFVLAMHINLALYSLPVLILFMVLTTCQSIDDKRKRKYVVGLFALILVLFPPWWLLDLGTHRTWVQEAFIPHEGHIALDGDRLVVSGSPVRVYKRYDSGWEQETELALEDEYDNDFGKNVEIDGNTIFIASSEPHTLPYKSGQRRGVHYSTTFDGVRWSELIRLPLPPCENCNCYGRVSAADRNVFVVANGAEVCVYERETEVAPWKFKTMLSRDNIPIRTEDLRMGYRDSVKIGPTVAVDGNRILIGGSVALFVRNLQTEQWEFDASFGARKSHRYMQDAFFSYQGNGVAIQGDTLVVGSAHKNYPDGVALVYKENPKTNRWHRVSKLTPRGGRRWWLPTRYLLRYGFGRNIHIDNGNIAISTINVSAPLRGNDDENAFVYARRPLLNRWFQQARLVDTSNPAAVLGKDIDISGDNLAVLGRQGWEYGIYLFHKQ